MTGAEEAEASGETRMVRYYTYQGFPMKDELICYDNLSTGYETICKGTQASTAANGISSVILDLAGYCSLPVSLLNSTLTAYHTFAEITGTSPVSGSCEDFTQVKLTYDICTKYTYADLGYGDGYRLGAVTQKVRLIDTDILRYYADYNGGSEVSVHQILNKTFVTDNFRKPAPAAIASLHTPWIERVNAEIYHHPIIF